MVRVPRMPPGLSPPPPSLAGILERSEFSALVEALGLLSGKDAEEREAIVDTLTTQLDDNNDGKARARFTRRCMISTAALFSPIYS